MIFFKEQECFSIKILTLNAHSLIENNYEEKLKIFTDTILKEQPDIIALQEVNQTINGAIIPENNLTGFYPCQSYVRITNDNHAYNVIKILNKNNLNYFWTWLPLKNGYGKFDEGLAILSLKPILKTDTFLISKIDDYENWKTRKVLGILTDEKRKEWYYNVHMGWWNDNEDPFECQWKKLNDHLSTLQNVWIMGDFNSPAEVRNEGYDLIKNSGWYDSYTLAQEKDIGFTVEKVIDGWKDKLKEQTKMRIDHIWCSNKISIKSSNVIFNGKNKAVVSDHYGVIISV